MRYWKDGWHSTPQDGAIEVSQADFESMQQGQAQGLSIATLADGSPALFDPRTQAVVEGVIEEVRKLEDQKSIEEAQKKYYENLEYLRSTDYRVTKNMEAREAEAPLPYDPVELYEDRQRVRDENEQLILIFQPSNT